MSKVSCGVCEDSCLEGSMYVCGKCASKAAESQTTANNTGSPKLPSSTDVWKMVVDLCADKKLFCDVEAARAISEAVYKFIYRQLRAGA
jgi:hypothetical protein